MKLSTALIHDGVHESDPVFGSVVPPIYFSSTFQFKNAKQGADRFAGREKGMIYSRFTNPTVQTLEKKLARLEGADDAIATASGMAAISLVLLHSLQSGDHIVAHTSLYGGTYELMEKLLPRYGIHVTFVNFTNADDIKEAITQNTKVLYFESPSNPTMEVINIEEVVKIAHTHKILSIFDNTFGVPPIQQPISLGVDVVVHSLTKYVGGHSDVVAGAIMGSQEMIDAIRYKSHIFLGSAMNPMAAYLLIRGLSTLHVRVQKQSENALAIAQWLEKHPAISNVYYPALPSHPQHEIVAKQMKFGGGVISITLKDGYKKAEAMVNSTKIFGLAVSLGGVESLIEHPASMTHSEYSEEDQMKAGIIPSLVRLAVGIEDVDDLIADLEQALE